MYPMPASTSHRLSIPEKRLRSHPAPVVKKSRSEAIWRRFRGACDHFFDRYKHRDALALEEVQHTRERLCSELEALLPVTATVRAHHIPVTAILDEAVRFSPKLTCFLPVKLHPDDRGTLHALPVPTNTSGDFTALGGTDGYVELERDTDDFPAGTVVPFHAWESP